MAPAPDPEKTKKITGRGLGNLPRGGKRARPVLLNKVRSLSIYSFYCYILGTPKN